MKTALVAPLRRMPRALDGLTYIVPDGLFVKRGDLVKIPLRSAQISGVVLSISENEIKNGKNIIEVIQNDFIPEWRLSVFEIMSNELVQSISSLLWIAFQKKPKLKNRISSVEVKTVRRYEVEYLKKAIKSTVGSLNSFIEVTDLVQASVIVKSLQKKFGSDLWIIVPHHHDRLFIPMAMTRAQALSKQEEPKAIVIIRSGSSEHASYDRNPRYDIRRFAELTAQTLNIPIVNIDVSPRIHDLIRDSKCFTPDNLRPDPAIIPLMHAKTNKNSIISHDLITAISETLQDGKSVLCSYNRKKDSLNKICLDCGRETESDVTCINCGGVNFKKRLPTINSLVALLKTQFPETKIVGIEKDNFAATLDDPCLIVSTRFYQDSIYSPQDIKKLGLVAEILADYGLHGTEYDSLEQTIVRLFDLWGIATRSQAKFMVQTWDFDLVNSILKNRNNLLQDESRVRKSLHYPPYGILARINGVDKVFKSDEYKTEISQLKKVPDNTIIQIWR